MSDGYRADLPGMAEAARLLDDATERLTPIPPLLETERDPALGPAELVEEVDTLSHRWSARVTAVRSDVDSASAGLRAARHHYQVVDESGEAELRRLQDDR
ncbi:hypothetical protein [Amycolatopsis nigrescens]|uniref:hypothetical protein n=1 Tax=Amycolatopsis nigrescens TaxID=381445 RepID=UPI000375F6BC|nr:hypothetical protein [Amycolatopsis nigrescens]